MQCWKRPAIPSKRPTSATGAIARVGPERSPPVKAAVGGDMHGGANRWDRVYRDGDQERVKGWVIGNPIMPTFFSEADRPDRRRARRQDARPQDAPPFRAAGNTQLDGSGAIAQGDGAAAAGAGGGRSLATSMAT